MYTQSRSDLVAETRAIAADAENVADDVRRTVAALATIFEEGKALYRLVCPVIQWLSAPPTGPSMRVPRQSAWVVRIEDRMPPPSR